MIKTKETLSLLDKYGLDKSFVLTDWQRYIDDIIPGISSYMIDDISGYDFSKDCLPIINEAINKKDIYQTIIDNFNNVTKGLDQSFIALFDKTIDVDIILYLGLCNGAGWALKYNDKQLVLLGIEKIIELKWYDKDKLKALIYHELGHIFQDTYGADTDKTFVAYEDNMYWSLYTEGVAMYIEQALIKDHDYYHQDINGYKRYLSTNIDKLIKDFMADAKIGDDRYFGDWRDYHGFGDAGYYLGARFINHLMIDHDLDDIIDLDIKEVKTLFGEFTSEYSIDL